MEKQLRTRSGCLGIQDTELQSPPYADKKLRNPQLENTSLGRLGMCSFLAAVASNQSLECIVKLQDWDTNVQGLGRDRSSRFIFTMGQSQQWGKLHRACDQSSTARPHTQKQGFSWVLMLHCHVLEIRNNFIFEFVFVTADGSESFTRGLRPQCMRRPSPC